MHNCGLYIHIPFCKRKCAYCNFYSVIPSKKLKNEYLDALMGDIKKWGGRTDRLFDTVYIGGGTPSYLEEDIVRLLDCVRENLNISSDAEITAEVNPDVSDLFLKSAYNSGVNRISVGIQSGNDKELTYLGRTHNRLDAKNTVKRIKSAGFKNISADLMIALPESDLSTLKSNLDFFFELDIPHISSYILKIEDKTKFGMFPPLIPDDDECAKQYLFMCDFLEERGYSHYEISNFALEGYESRHNLKYWRLDEYLGIGPAAHSFFCKERFYYPSDIKEYIKNPQTVFEDTGGGEYERIMLGLRLKDGVDLYEHLNKSSELKVFLENLRKENLININGTEVSLTDRGFLVSNSIISQILEYIL